MKRILLVLIALAVAAFAGWYYWNLSQKISSAPVAALLPRETIFIAQIPDFNEAYEEWRRCDIYQLYREPAVQDFLRKPLSNVPKNDAVSQTLREIEQLAPKNAFIALTSMENNNPKALGGFRFRGRREDAERIIGGWRSALMGQNSNLKREKVQYERYEIEVVKAAPFSVATVYDPPWFLAATDVRELETLLDRADRRGARPESSLDKDDAYRAAISRRPSNYAAFLYLQPRHSRNDSQRFVLLSDQVPPQAKAPCLRNCAASRVRCSSRKEI